MAVIIILRLLSSDVMVEDVEDGHFWLLTDDCVTNAAIFSTCGQLLGGTRFLCPAVSLRQQRLHFLRSDSKCFLRLEDLSRMRCLSLSLIHI